MLNQKSIIDQLKLIFHQILLLFDAFHEKSNDLINVLNINVDHIKKILDDVSLMHITKKCIACFTSVYVNAFNINISVNKRLKCNNIKDMNRIF
jgi:hypothetical protein